MKKGDSVSLIFSSLLLIAVVVFADSKFIKHKRRNGASKRIVDGDVALAKDWPFAVHLNFHQKYAPWKVCGGALVHERFVLTAGHCTQGKKGDYASVAEPKEITVGLGRTVLSSVKDQHNFTVSRIIPYPRFKEINMKLIESQFDMPHRFDYDLALLELSTPVKLSQTVQLVKLRDLECKEKYIAEEETKSSPVDVPELAPASQGSGQKPGEERSPDDYDPSMLSHESLDNSQVEEDTVEGSANEVTDNGILSDTTKPPSGSPTPSPSSPLSDDSSSGISPNAVSSGEAQIGTEGSAQTPPPEIVEDARFTDCHMAGWGRTSTFATPSDFMSGDYTPSSNLLQMNVKILARKSAYDLLLASKYGSKDDLSDKVLCGRYKTKRAFGCLGDSGSPMICVKDGVKYLDGVTVGSNMLCNPDGAPMFFTKVGKYISWIESVIFAPEEPKETHESQDEAMETEEESGDLGIPKMLG